jgi:hypothetical protein
MSIKLKPGAGSHISAVCLEAVMAADKNNTDVEFSFNDTAVIVHPGEDAEAVAARWQKDFEAAGEAYRNSAEYKQAEEKRKKEYEDRCAAAMVEKASTETEMRDTEDKHPCTKEQLAQYVESLVNRSHDYGTCVYAMSLAATAAFNYVAHKLGVTGFQASCADLDILRRTRSLKGPFILLKAEDALYPQYNLHEKLSEALAEWQPWMKEQAKAKLAESGQAHPNVVKHWKWLAGVE